jgi:hypothetical protein
MGRGTCQTGPLGLPAVDCNGVSTGKYVNSTTGTVDKWVGNCGKPAEIQSAITCSQEYICHCIENQDGSTSCNSILTKLNVLLVLIKNENKISCCEAPPLLPD